MDLLILGGTLYLGRHATEAALARGHRVTLFNRGRTHAGLFPEVERLVGDRDGDLSALAAGRWDAVIDTSAYLPAHARATAALLADRVAQYLLVSTISVYAEPVAATLDEASPLRVIPDDAPEELSGESYGALKARCERAVEQHLPGRATHVRAGLILGPYDNSARAAYWPRRIAAGGEVLAPGTPAQPVQFVDARDLAGWMVRVCEQRLAGVFNATGPRRALTLGELLDGCRTVTDGASHLTWVDEAWLLEQGVAPYSELPLWLPASHHAVSRVDASRALAAGLTLRPFTDTLRDVFAWDRTCSPEARRPQMRLAGREPLSVEREAELLAAWRAHSPAA